MTTSFTLDVNGAARTVAVESGTPLLNVLRNDFEFLLFVRRLRNLPSFGLDCRCSRTR